MNKVIIDVKDIMDEVGAEEHRVFEQKFSPIKTETGEIEFVQPVKFDIKMENTGSGVRITGHIKSALKLVCSRCLNEFSFPVDWQVDELFYRKGIPKEEEAYSMENTTIDLGPPTEEEFVLAIPMKPLCHEACQGICPICGELITGEHKPHKEMKIDTRLEVLKKLLKEKGGEE
ncbi:MAG: YceD family protein [Firmicutes bacterium]|nr:YceD family protein [Bacillota bacterium]